MNKNSSLPKFRSVSASCQLSWPHLDFYYPSDEAKGAGFDGNLPDQVGENPCPGNVDETGMSICMAPRELSNSPYSTPVMNFGLSTGQTVIYSPEVSSSNIYSLQS